MAEEAVAVAEVRAETRVAARLQRQWEAKALQLQTEFEEMLGRVHAREKQLKEKVAAQDREIEMLKKGLRSEHIATVDAGKGEGRRGGGGGGASAAAAASPPPPPRPRRRRRRGAARSIHAAAVEPAPRRSSIRAWRVRRRPADALAAGGDVGAVGAVKYGLLGITDPPFARPSSVRARLPGARAPPLLPLGSGPARLQPPAARVPARPSSPPPTLWRRLR